MFDISVMWKVFMEATGYENNIWAYLENTAKLQCWAVWAAQLNDCYSYGLLLTEILLRSMDVEYVLKEYGCIYVRAVFWY